MTAVTYYKLESGYPGDVTKGCGLTGSEIDKNFHFLRGYDIKNAYIDEEAGTIVLERLDQNVIIIEGVKEYIKKISTSEGFVLSGTTYDKEKGILHIVVNETDYPVEGFYTQVTAGDGIKGKGTLDNPLKVDGLLLTGFFAPVKTFINYEKGEKIPETGDKGDRYISREYISPYGLVYTYNGIKKIENNLKNNNHGWRIPTLDDWASLFNAIECPADRNHLNINEGAENGRIAGFLLKEQEKWDEEVEILGAKGFKVLPTETEENEIISTFWTNSDNSFNGQHAKRFHKGKGTIQHRVENRDNGNLHSLRLVRDLEERPFLNAETINGVLYNCIQMECLDKEGNKKTLSWTVENVTFDTLLGTEDARYPQIFESGSYKFYLNEWNVDTLEWDKREFVDGSIVPIHSYSGYTDEAFILKDGELKPYFDSIYSKVKEYVDAKVAQEKKEREEADTLLNEKIEGEIAQRKAETKDLSERLIKESAERQAEDASLSQRIANETAERRAEDTSLSNRIMTEAAERQAEDASLSQRIATEAAERQTKDAELNTKIDIEIAQRQAEDASLSQRIATEAAERQAEDASLSQRIATEAAERQTKDAELNTKIDIEIAQRQAEDTSLSNRIVAEAQERINHDIQIKQYNANVNGVTLNTNDGTEIKITFDGNFGIVNFYNA